MKKVKLLINLYGKRCRGTWFTSQNSLNYIRKGSDHHKLWQILEYTYMDLTDELLVPYVWCCLLSNIDLDISGYWRNCDSNKNVKYLYTQEMAFTYLHALMLLWKRIHMNSSKAVFAARNWISLLFFIVKSYFMNFVSKLCNLISWELLQKVVCLLVM